MMVQSQIYKKNIRSTTKWHRNLYDRAKGVPSNSGITSIDHHRYYDSEEKTSIGEKTSIEQIADILGIKLSNFDMMIAANDVGYIPK